jgi:hypothetical protein
MANHRLDNQVAPTEKHIIILKGSSQTHEHTRISATASKVFVADGSDLTISCEYES